MARRKVAKQRSEVPDTVLRFSGEHLWVRADADRALIGISDYGQAAAGEILAVELPEVGDAVECGEAFGEIESVRTVLALVAPVTGTVLAANGDLEDHPALANEDPYREGWLIEVALTDECELEALMGSEDYEEFIASNEEG